MKSVSLTLLFTFIAQGAIAHKPANTTSKAQKNTSKSNKDAPTSENEYTPAERDFDTIRGFQSYDPATKKWSKIEDFDTVDILKDATEKREDRYIYRNFWAYDALTKRWRKVDVRDYGYKLGQLAVEKQPRRSFDFWKNWNLGLRAGWGGTFYTNRVGHFSITEIDREYYLQTAEQELEKEAYQPGWFGNVYTHVEYPSGEIEGNLDANHVKNGKKIVFRGEGWTLPITLFTHYTFFKRLRLGAGLELEINQLKELRPREDADNLKTFKTQLAHEWFFNTAWFGLLGLKVFHEPQQDIFVDLQIGRNYNLGAELHRFFKKHTYIYNGWLFGVGMIYERKLNDYFKFLARLGGDWKVHDDTPQDIEEDDPFIKIHQVAVHLDLGIQVSFGKDTEENDEEREVDQDAASAKENTEEDQLKEVGGTLKKLEDQREQLKGKIKWKLR